MQCVSVRTFPATATTTAAPFPCRTGRPAHLRLCVAQDAPSRPVPGHSRRVYCNAGHCARRPRVGRFRRGAARASPGHAAAPLVRLVYANVYHAHDCVSHSTSLPVLLIDLLTHSLCPIPPRRPFGMPHCVSCEGWWELPCWTHPHASFGAPAATRTPAPVCSGM